MRKIIIIIGAVILVGLVIVGGIYLGDKLKQENQFAVCGEVCTDDAGCGSGFCFEGICRNGECPNQEDCQCIAEDVDKRLVRKSFFENFYDGEIDDFWKWDDGGGEGGSFEIDEVYEELILTAEGQTSQWSALDNVPKIYFLTDRDFVMDVEYEFDPRVDFQHAGIGIIDPESGEWVRVSRSYDTHSLESPDDQPNSIYVMQKKDDQILKFNHENYRDVRVYVRMKKIDDEVVFEYSDDGKQWQVLDQVSVDGWSEEVKVYLFVYSTDINGIAARFLQWQFDVL
ncbi:DUF1349 domain-containing protein [Patescibacteria group bacterium]|nr:DUF1349 domain-containing protein [Patescibacteria group bacterium]